MPPPAPTSRLPAPFAASLRTALPSVCALVAVFVCVAPVVAQDKPSREQIGFFERRVRPVLVTHCYDCHAGETANLKGGLRVDTAAGLREGGDSGPAVVPGKPNESLLLDAVRYETYEMPPKGQLPDEVVAALARWIEMGAPDPRDAQPPAPPPEATADAARSHWAFQRPVRHDPPAVADAAWPSDDLDRFILAKLEAKQLRPADDADRLALIRRLSFDLLGLPPTAEQAEQFQRDASPDALPQLVDRLLASEHFGQRWARHWLDVARYADTKGYVFQESRNYEEAFKYRDWVIDALNDDMPIDRFLKFQLAADQLVDADNTHELAAMGFLTLGRRFINNKHDIIDDRIDVVTRGLQGLTVTCARCHDHKYDPVPMADYYALYGVFASCREPGDAPCSLRMVDDDQPFQPYVFLRGSPHNRGDAVPRQFLAVVAGEQRTPFTHGSGRLEMAEMIASGDNPLTARVFVNRAWGHLFGRAVVGTPSDFGTRGESPSHPQLLDTLACDFVADGWSLKRLVRRIVLSRTYRQRSVGHGGEEIDPENTLLWRASRRRLDWESLRDAMLSASGQLDTTMGGPSVPLTTEPFTGRRTVYGRIERQNLPGVFRTFDFANPDTHVPRRFETTVPQQALFLMNSPFVHQQAQGLAERTATAAGDDVAARVTQMVRFALARDPSAQEHGAAVAFVREGLAADASATSVPVAAWQYAYGAFDPQAKRLSDVAPLPHFTGGAYQGGAELPDAQLGWVTLNAAGGHPGNDLQHAAVRRWITPADGFVSIGGQLKHPSDQGDGVRASVVLGGKRVLGQWVAQHGEAATQLADINVKQGDRIDLVIDCRAGPSFDGYQWNVDIRLTTPDGATRQFNTATDFAGPPPPPLNAWARLAQILLMSNEFAFVD